MAPAVPQGLGDGPKRVRAASKEWPLWPLLHGGTPVHRTLSLERGPWAWGGGKQCW